MTKKKSNHGGNAFNLLMSEKKRKRLSLGTSSTLVQCPVCSKSIPDSRLNTHLDECMKASVPTQSSSLSVPNTKTIQGNINEARKEDEEDAMRQKIGNVENKNVSASSELHFHKVKEDSMSSKSLKKKSGKDAFKHMMKHSAVMFSSPSQARTQTFHMNSNYSVSWVDSDILDPSSGNGVVQWSDMTKIKKELNCNEKSDDDEGCVNKEESIAMMNRQRLCDVDLFVTSSFLPAAAMPRLVHRLSRLSVPVLKSILQKSIRRRLPLPSVRVALELASKSWGDFIRRLPIIVIEDSFLHPDFPLLVWTMVSESKGFIPPLPLITKIMRIVFEIASCPMKDALTSLNRPRNDMKTTTLSLRGTEIEKEFTDDIGKITLLRSILLRGHYGGMACDILMLVRYVKEWRYRFNEVKVPVNISNRIYERLRDDASVLKQSKTDDIMNWEEVPNLLHSKSILSSAKLVSSMTMYGIQSLSLKDVSLAGIDFHCSSILEDTVLSDSVKVPRLLDELTPLIPKHLNDDARWIKGIALMKEAMWILSAGVNRRISITGNELLNNIDEQRKEILQKAWKLVSDDVEAYAKRYVSSRLSQSLNLKHRKG